MRDRITKYKVLKECVTPDGWHRYQGDIIAVGEELYHTNRSLFERLSFYDFIEPVEEKESQKTVWDLKSGDVCWKIDAGWAKGYTNIFFNTYAEALREVGDLFLSAEDAEKELARRKAKQILLQDTNGFRPDWDNAGQTKWEVAYKHSEDELHIHEQIMWDFGTIVFATSDDALSSIAQHEKEWKTYLGVDDERF